MGRGQGVVEGAHWWSMAGGKGSRCKRRARDCRPVQPVHRTRWQWLRLVCMTAAVLEFCKRQDRQGSAQNTLGAWRTTQGACHTRQ